MMFLRIDDLNTRASDHGHFVPRDSSRKPRRSSITSAASRVPCSFMHNTTPLTTRSGLIRRETSETVSRSLPMPCNASTCGWRGMRTSLAAARALSVSTPRDGGQSMRTKSNSSGSAFSASRRIISRPTMLNSSTSTAARSMWDGTIQRLSRTACRASAIGVDCVSIEYVPGQSAAGSSPRWSVRWAWGSRSMSITRWPASARAAPTLTAVVVLPTPPFWLMVAIRLIGPPLPMRPSQGAGK